MRLENIFFITDMDLWNFMVLSGIPPWYEKIMFDLESSAIAQMDGLVILNNFYK